MSSFLASVSCSWTRGLPWRGQGRRLGAEDSGLERGSGRAPTKARSGGGVDEVGQGMGQRRRGCRLAETIAPQRLSGVASSMGGADAVMDRPEQEDEQGLRE